YLSQTLIRLKDALGLMPLCLRHDEAVYSIPEDIPMNPTAIRQRRPMTEARLKANRENAKKAALSGRSGRPRGSIDGNRLSLRERCRVRDEEHVATLERLPRTTTILASSWWRYAT